MIMYRNYIEGILHTIDAIKTIPRSRHLRKWIFKPSGALGVAPMRTYAKNDS